LSTRQTAVECSGNSSQPSLISAAQLDEFLITGVDSKWPAWVPQVWQQISSTLADSDFPCLFGRRAKQQAYMLVCHVDSFSQEVDLLIFTQEIEDYLKLISRRYHDDQMRPPLIVMVKPQPKLLSLDQYHQAAWGMLQFLHDHDPSPWPNDVPVDTQDPLWSFCFGGQQLFINVSTPAHQVRRSRRLCDTLTLVIQPRQNFDLIAGLDSSSTEPIRNLIRQRMARYDGIAAPDDLGVYGTSKNREWTQYMVPDTNQSDERECPLHVRPKGVPKQ
jgi:FPC/CPF motif-containing protein YcgG